MARISDPGSSFRLKSGLKLRVTGNTYHVLARNQEELNLCPRGVTWDAKTKTSENTNTNTDTDTGMLEICV